MDRVLIVWGLERKPSLGGAVAFAGGVGVAAASLGGTREFSHLSRCSTSFVGATAWPSKRAPGDTNAEAQIKERMNLPKGGKTEFKSRPLVAALLFWVKVIQKLFTTPERGQPGPDRAVT
jgi:hypothetical protein